jgi:hypothetical protein
MVCTCCLECVNIKQKKKGYNREYYLQHRQLQAPGERRTRSDKGKRRDPNRIRKVRSDKGIKRGPRIARLAIEAVETMTSP